jgi:glycosyltransferase involved in cell wall biosynthesis
MAQVPPVKTSLPAGKSLRVCYFGTYRAEYSRNRIMIEGLRRAGVEVVECQEQLWKSIEDRVQTASGGWKRPGFWWRALRAYLRLIQKHRNIGDYDVLMIGYPAQMDVFLARYLSRRRGKPLVWDVFMSIYLIALERGLDQRSRFSVNLIRKIEKRALALPDMLIQDTADYVDWFHRTYGISKERFRLVPTGADERVYQPSLPLTRLDNDLQVLYYGTFIPNHGVGIILEAASLLAKEPRIHFEFIGDGPELYHIRARAEQLKLANVNFIPWMEVKDLAARAAQADILLGAFGNTPQSIMTIQNKIFEGLAMGKAVITGDSPAVRKAMVHGEHIYLCERGNPAALAKAILALRDEQGLREQLGRGGGCLFKEKYSLEQIGQLAASHLVEVTQ